MAGIPETPPDSGDLVPGNIPPEVRGRSLPKDLLNDARGPRPLARYPSRVERCKAVQRLEMARDRPRSRTKESCVSTRPGSESEPTPEVVVALRTLQDAIGGLLASHVPSGATVRDVRDRLAIGHRLAWTILSFRRASTVTELVRSLPGRRGWDSILKAFEELEDRQEHLARTRDALAAFRRVCDEGEIDLAALVEPAAARDTPESERYRREEYLKHRSIWPVHSRAKIVAKIVAPDPADPNMGCLATLMMLVGAERTAPGPMLEVARTLIPEDALRQRLPPGTDLAGVFGHGGPMPPLLEAFSSPGVIGRELHRMEETGGFKRVGYANADPQRTSPLMLTFGQLLPRMGPLFGGHEDRVVVAAEAPGPVEWCLLDVLWPRDLPAGGPWQTRLSTFQSHAGENVDMALTFPTLVDQLDTTRLDSITLPSAIKEAAPDYRRALKASAAAVGRSLDEFEIHRAALRYTLPRTSIVASRPLAPGPDAS